MCRERFHHYCSDEKNIIASFLKFAVYINNHKMLSGNIFGLILRNKMAATGVFCQSWKVLISPVLLILEVWDDKPTCRKSWGGNLLVWSDLTFNDPSFKVKQG